MNDIDFDELDKAVSSALGPDATSPAVTPPAPRPPAGRFMDVVHPSSEMRPPTRPMTTSPMAPPAAFPPVVSAPVSMPAMVAPAPAQVPETPALESPFLPDAKVEKRPLGSMESTGPLDPIQSTDVPPEALEVSEEALIGATESSDTKPTDTPAAAVESVQPAEPIEPVETPTAAPVTPGLYTERAPSLSQTRPIFDTEAYHQPMKTPKKKSTVLLIILWILGLLVIGSGVGALLYFYVLPLIAG